MFLEAAARDVAVDVGDDEGDDVQDAQGEVEMSPKAVSDEEGAKKEGASTASGDNAKSGEKEKKCVHFLYYASESSLFGTIALHSLRVAEYKYERRQSEERWGGRRADCVWGQSEV